MNSEAKQTPQPLVKTISLLKGKEMFIFRYEVGREAAMLDVLIDFVNRCDLWFDWFDAAVISHQLGREIAHELKTRLQKKGNIVFGRL